LKDLPKIEQIRKVLESKNELLIEYEFDAIEPEYFNELVRELTNYTVSEIRPLQKVWITKGIETNILNQYLNQLKNHIVSYNEIRNQVFREFLNSLGIDEIEDEFYKLREKLKESNQWPKGTFKNWNYWSHGGDIEFDNTENGNHFNIRMSNVKDIKFWSIHRYLCSILNQTKETKFLADNKEAIRKMLDLLVLQKTLKTIRTPFGEKQYVFVN